MLALPSKAQEYIKAMPVVPKKGFQTFGQYIETHDVSEMDGDTVTLANVYGTIGYAMMDRYVGRIDRSFFLMMQDAIYEDDKNVDSKKMLYVPISPSKYELTEINTNVLCWDDYKDVQKLFQAKDKQQFDYMTLVDKLRWDMLKRTKCYLKNIYGDGYVIVPKEEQAEYGFTQTMKEIKESLRKGALIIGNVRPLPMFAVSSYNDIKSRFSTIKSVLSALKL